MDETSSLLGSFEDPASQKSARRGHYLIFQAGGWGLILILQLVGFLTVRLPDLKPDAYPRIHPLAFALGSFILPPIFGFLITHFSRRFLRGWRWDRLNWNSLIPRMSATAAVQSLLFLVLTLGVNGPLLHNPEFAVKSLSRFLISWIGNSILFCGWLGAYFFYHLFERYNRSENQRLSLIASQKEAELRALKSQVNPHFIFNALNSLRSLIEEDPQRARLAVTQFANLLRYSLQSAHLETVSLAEELQVAKDYLALEQVRYQGRLQLRFEIAPEALALRVPPMLLQTLAENAIKYGIAQRRQGGEISIRARYSDESLCLQVTNPEAPDGPARSGPESTGMGLKNATNRLRLLFGEKATLQLRRDAPGLVVAEVVLPLNAIAPSAA